MGQEAEHFINLLSPYIHSYGYWVAFFGIMLENAGIPVPAETTLVILSFFASQGALKIWLVIPIAILGDTVGDNIGFFIGRTGGRRIVEKFGPFLRVDKARLEAMEALFREKGARTVFTAHFFSTTRFVAAFAAGVSRMPYQRFLAVNVAAATVFVTMVAGATYYFGANLGSTLRFFHILRLAGLVVAVLLVTAYVYHFYLRKKHLHRRLGLKLIFASVAASIVFGLAVYAVSGALIVLPRTGKYAGLQKAELDGAGLSVERGFISDIDGRNVLITALGEPVITLSGEGDVKITVRNIRAPDTAVRAEGGKLNRPIALDLLTLNFTVKAGKKTVASLGPKRASGGFVWAAAGDTRDWGPVFGLLVDSINKKDPAFVIHAGNFVKDGDRRHYRAFLYSVGGLTVPLYTCPGQRELRDHGEKAYGELFGPRDYSFTYRGSAFIVLDSTRLISGAGFTWLEGELKKAEGLNIFVVTYRAPVDDAGFTGLLSRYGVKAVYSVKSGNGGGPAGKVRYIGLARVPGRGYSYVITRVNGKEVSFEEVAVVPKGLTAADRIMLAYEDILRRIAGYVN